MKPSDLAGQDYWESGWGTSLLPQPVNPHAPSLSISLRRVHEYLSGQLQGFGGGQGLELIEIGCGCSAWLPYFAIEHGCLVSGLDYSPIGCRQAEAILAKAGVAAELICRNFFEPPARVYDIVVSFGVAEHFRPTEDCIRAFARYLRPGGLMITETPNMAGLVGTVQKLVNAPAFDIHVPLTREALAMAHEKAGLKVLDSAYLLSAGFTVCAPPNPAEPGCMAKTLILGGLRKLSRQMWRWDSRLPKTRLFSGYVVCTARKSAE